MKPLGYFASGEAIDSISEAFGDRLDDLTVTEKLHLQSIISLFLAAVSYASDDYNLRDAEVDYPLEVTTDVQRILEILDESRNEHTLKSFLHVLSAQIYDTPIVFDDALYDAALSALTGYGVQFEAAKSAAQVVAGDHRALTRTPQQQALVKTAWGQLNRRNCNKSELADLQTVLAI